MFKNTVLASFIIMALCNCEEPQPLKNNTSGGKTDTTGPGIFPGRDSILADTASYEREIIRMVQNKPSGKWPVRKPYPLKGALLPFNRVVAYYGNFYSTGMGILGQLKPAEMLKKFQEEINNWQKADTVIPVIPAIHYIAVTAQSAPGSGNKYRLRMPFSEIDKAIELAKKINGIVFLDIQVGHSTLQQEIPPLKKYLSMPNVHLGIDPEYSMKNGKVPSTSIGTFDAEDINYASEFLAGLVKKDTLPPKILVIHRFTKGMVTNSRKIKLHPEVQVVMNMDGFGEPAKKINSYKSWITGEPVQFTGFKLFYKNDKNSGRMMTPAEVLKLYPRPVYIQYQ